MYDILVQFLGEPTNQVQENFLYFGSYFILIFLISVMFDLAVQLTKS